MSKVREERREREGVHKGGGGGGGGGERDEERGEEAGREVLKANTLSCISIVEYCDRSHSSFM